MAEWLFVGVFGVFVGHHGNSVVQLPDAEEDRRHSQLHHLLRVVGARVQKLVQLRQWQAAGGMSRQQVIIDPILTETDRPVVGRIRQRDEPGYEGIWCELLLPRAWLSQPVDGLRAVQATRAVLATLDAVGSQYGLGVIPVRNPASAGDAPDDPFAAPPRHRKQAMAYASEWLGELLQVLGPDELLVATRTERSGRTAARLDRFIENMGELVEHDDQTLPDGKKVMTWKIRANW
jgi:hypothetical protein